MLSSGFGDTLHEGSPPVSCVKDPSEVGIRIDAPRARGDGVLYLLAVVTFVIAAFVRRRQGLDLSLVNKEIPVE